MTDHTELVKALREYSGCRKGEIARITSDAAAAIEELQAQLPKRGEWIRKDAELYYWHECSKCGERPLYDRYANRVLSAYCPNCGAEMERADEK